VDDALREQVWQRAQNRCEYCQIAQEFSIIPFEIDHIVARKHRGRTSESNLALSCFYDNSFKGSDIASFDPQTGKLTRLYHSRGQAWARHFQWVGAVLLGRTAVGRTTIETLQINHPLRIEQREALISAGLFPPKMS
jgi:hypothetical protein